MKMPIDSVGVCIARDGSIRFAQRVYWSIATVAMRGQWVTMMIPKRGDDHVMVRNGKGPKVRADLLSDDGFEDVIPAKEAAKRLAEYRRLVPAGVRKFAPPSLALDAAPIHQLCRSRYWRDDEVRERLIALHRTVEIRVAIETLEAEFGEARTPQKSTVGRIWQMLDDHPELQRTALRADDRDAVVRDAAAAEQRLADAEQSLVVRRKMEALINVIDQRISSAGIIRPPLRRSVFSKLSAFFCNLFKQAGKAPFPNAKLRNLECAQIGDIEAELSLLVLQHGDALFGSGHSSSPDHNEAKPSEPSDSAHRLSGDAK